MKLIAHVGNEKESGGEEEVNEIIFETHHLFSQKHKHTHETAQILSNRKHVHKCR